MTLAAIHRARRTSQLGLILVKGGPGIGAPRVTGLDRPTGIRGVTPDRWWRRFPRGLRVWTIRLTLWLLVGRVERVVGLSVGGLRTRGQGWKRLGGVGGVSDLLFERRVQHAHRSTVVHLVVLHLAPTKRRSPLHLHRPIAHTDLHHPSCPSLASRHHHHHPSASVPRPRPSCVRTTRRSVRSGDALSPSVQHVSPMRPARSNDKGER
jgi:hypothetical protein